MYKRQTYNGAKLPITVSMRKCTEEPLGYYWLRSPNNSSGSGTVSLVLASDGSLKNSNATGRAGVRPALWVPLTQIKALYR